MQITIKQIAQYTKTSRGTVDKVLHNRPGVNEQTRARILKAAEELHYQPNIIGKALVMQQKPKRIGIIVSSDGNYYIQEVLRGINTANAEYAPFGLEIDTRILKTLDPAEELTLLDELQNCDGLAVFPIDDDTVKSRLRAFSANGTAVITFNSQVSGIDSLCYIGQDNYRCGRVAASLLAKLIPADGKAALLIGATLLPGHAARAKGFLDKIREVSPYVSVIDITEEYDDSGRAYEQTLRICREHPDLDGLYITSAGQLGVCEALRDIGNTRVHVICHDMSPEMLQYMQSGMISFSIEQAGFDQGMQMVKALFEYLMKGKEITEYMESPLRIVTDELL